jgi:hypothetical protein
VIGLLPLPWEAGVGADVSARTAAPVVGGLWSCMFLTLLALPAAYAMWRRHQVRVAMTVSVRPDAITTSRRAAWAENPGHTPCSLQRLPPSQQGMRGVNYFCR